MARMSSLFDDNTSSIFAPAYVANDPNSMAALAAYNARRYPVTRAMIDEQRAAGMVDPEALRVLVQGGSYDAQAGRDRIAKLLAAQPRAASTTATTRDSGIASRYPQDYKDIGIGGTQVGDFGPDTGYSAPTMDRVFSSTVPDFDTGKPPPGAPTTPTPEQTPERTATPKGEEDNTGKGPIDMFASGTPNFGAPPAGNLFEGGFNQFGAVPGGRAQTQNEDNTPNTNLPDMDIVSPSPGLPGYGLPGAGMPSSGWGFSPGAPMTSEDFADYNSDVSVHDTPVGWSGSTMATTPGQGDFTGAVTPGGAGWGSSFSGYDPTPGGGFTATGVPGYTGSTPGYAGWDVGVPSFENAPAATPGEGMNTGTVSLGGNTVSTDFAAGFSQGFDMAAAAGDTSGDGGDTSGDGGDGGGDTSGVG